MDVSKILSTFFALFCICASTYATPIDDDSLKNVQNGVHNLNAQFIKIIAESSKNSLFSPLNVYHALALVHLGATGSTRNEFSTSLQLPSEEDKLTKTHANLGKILDQIQNTQPGAEVKVASGIFVQNGVDLKKTYIQANKDYYKSDVQRVDFQKASTQATETVNEWISTNTKKRIPKLFSNPIPKSTLVLLASALYFNAFWQSPFKDYQTSELPFSTAEKAVKVPTMASTMTIPYVKNEALQFEAISLPYESDFSMLVVLPAKNQPLNSLVDKLTAERYGNLVESISSNHSYVSVQLPRFKFRFTKNINDDVRKLGINKIFAEAEFGNMLEKGDLHVSDITHAAEIEVTEGGTTASAVTVVEFQKYSAVRWFQPVVFFVDRPFLFSIYHTKTGIVLFSGIVRNPAESS